MKRTYSIVDDQGRRVGVLFLEAEPQPAGLLQSVARGFGSEPGPVTHVERHEETRSFWASDGITYTIAGLFAGGVVLVYTWSYDLGGGAWVAGVALAAGLGLHIFKIVLHRPYNPNPEPTKPGKQTIAVEISERQGQNIHTTLDEIQDESITIDELRRVAVAWSEGTPFSREPMRKAAKLSQPKMRKIKKEFELLNMCFTDKGNRTHLTLRGKAVLRKLAQ